MCAIFAIGCGKDLTARPEVLGPVTHVRVFQDASPSSTTSAIAVGGTARFLLMIYDGRDSTLGAASWLVRSPTIAGTVSSSPGDYGIRIQGSAIGSTYVVGQIVDNGNLFIDSIRVTVTAP